MGSSIGIAEGNMNSDEITGNGNDATPLILLSGISFG